MISNVLIYKVFFMVSLVVAEVIFSPVFKRRRKFPLVFALGMAALIGIAVVVPVIENEFYILFLFLALFVVTLLWMKLLYREPWVNIMFCGIAAYTCQHFAYQLTNTFLVLIRGGREVVEGMYSTAVIDFAALDIWSLFYALIFLYCYFTVFTAFFYIFGKKIRANRDMKVNSISKLLLIGLGILVDVGLNAVFIYSSGEITVPVRIIVYIYGMLSCFLFLYVQSGLIDGSRMKRELAFVQRIREEEKKQYMTLKSNMESVNIKAHDMKHRLRADGLVSAAAADDIERAISAYDSEVCCGDQTLDIVLTEKSRQCLEKNIVFTCVADGEKLSFMAPEDIFSLFGNAIDNAIEATERIADAEKRMIELKLYAVRHFLTVNITNTYEGELTADESGLYRSSKSEPDKHGFGLKSIRFTVDKYDGNLAIKHGDGLFELNMVFPI